MHMRAFCTDWLLLQLLAAICAATAVAVPSNSLHVIVDV